MGEKDYFHVLCLDGGGAKGIYTLGVLSELEKYLQTPLYKKFNLIYGTSTGSIIASLLGSGYKVEDIKKFYLTFAPKIMKPFTAQGRTDVLRGKAEEVFGDRLFDDFKTDVCIIATRGNDERPIVFRSKPEQIPGYQGVSPGFGVRIADAVMASCSTFPFFKKVHLRTDYHGELVLLDGGFSASNPCLFAIAEALSGYQVPREKLKVLSVGVGKYLTSEKSLPPLFRLPVIRDLIYLCEVAASSRSNAIVRLQELLFSDIYFLRINEYFFAREYGTHLLETDPEKLLRMFDMGVESFHKNKKRVDWLLAEESSKKEVTKV